ncbi:MAG: hypothetical protein RLZZ584_1147 [Pseudomonadota bacterium]|jgi:photosystem II stability/assembly factor-like uncharacterized protein
MTTRPRMTTPAPTRRRLLLQGGALALLGTTAAGLRAAGDSAAPAAASGGPGTALIRPLAAKSLVLAITRAGQRLVAVGERGHVLLSDDEGKAWRQARSVPARNTLTAVHASDATTLWAVGHGGLMLKSTDAGEHWQRVATPAQTRDVLLSVLVQAGGRGLAVGGFGFALATTDGGASWQQAELIAGEQGEKHLNQIFLSPQGSWLIAAEGGHVLRSDDPAGARWTAVKTPYAGSLWSGLALPGNGSAAGSGAAGGARHLLIACGMRGNIVRSSDDGQTWSHQAVAGAGSFTSVVALADQRVALVGVDGTLVVGHAGTGDFKLHRLDDRASLHGAVALGATGQPVTSLAVATGAGPRVIDLPG